MKTKSVNKRDWPAHRLAASGRTAALLIALVLSAGSSVPLHAAVIDDFEGPTQKWLCGGGGCDYLGPTQAGGRLTFAGQFPAPPPPSNPYVTMDNVYWPATDLSGLTIDDGQTLELRVDLVSVNEDDVFTMLGTDKSGSGGYYVIKDRDEIGLVKLLPTGQQTLLYWEERPIDHQNVTLVLGLSRAGGALIVTARVEDKENGGATLFQRSFSDGPGQDAGIPNPQPHDLVFFVGDSGPPYFTIDSPWLGVFQDAEGTPPPLELVVDNLEYTLYPAPQLAIEKSVILSWPENTAEEQIVLTAESLAGPWIPCLEPIFKRNGELCVVVPTTSAQQYFKLARGSQLSDDFSDPTRQWWECFPDPQPFQVDRADGALRISKPAPGGVSRGVLGAVQLAEIESYLHADFAMSVDILDWTTNLMATGAEQQIGLMARATPTPANCQGSLNSHVYIGEVDFRENSSATVAIFASPPNANLASESVTLDPEKAYRLVFCGSGSELTLRLFDLENLGVPLVSLQVTNRTLTQGVPGLWIAALSGTCDITIDNYFVSGTKP